MKKSRRKKSPMRSKESYHAPDGDRASAELEKAGLHRAAEVVREISQEIDRDRILN